MALGIPDDSPENTVRFIMLIVKEEADAMGALVTAKHVRKGIFREIFLHAVRAKRTFDIALTWAPNDLLHHAVPNLGSGHIDSDWALLLSPKDIDTAPLAPPFRWRMYAPGEAHLDRMPRHYLDGPRLRQILRQRLC